MPPIPSSERHAIPCGVVSPADHHGAVGGNTISPAPIAAQRAEVLHATRRRPAKGTILPCGVVSRADHHGAVGGNTISHCSYRRPACRAKSGTATSPRSPSTPKPVRPTAHAPSFVLFLSSLYASYDLIVSLHLPSRAHRRALHRNIIPITPFSGHLSRGRKGFPLESPLLYRIFGAFLKGLGGGCSKNRACSVVWGTFTRAWEPRPYLYGYGFRTPLGKCVAGVHRKPDPTDAPSADSGVGSSKLSKPLPDKSASGRGSSRQPSVPRSKAGTI
jgi:hypothetical protein